VIARAESPIQLEYASNAVQHSSLSGPPAPNRSATPQRLLTPKEAARLLNLSVSWLAKRRLAGDGPPYVKLGGAVRYVEASLQQWMKAHQRLSTSG
jgi:predicted DNA-binding transcriptional regulator AlpA